MSPTIATLLTIAFVAVLFMQDLWRKHDDSEVALWLPVLWMIITGSRFVSQWISLGAGTTDEGVEGSLIDALYFLTLILAGVAVLVRRHVTLSAFLQNNRWLFALLVYSLVAIAWSDFPFIAFKRWIKTLGHPIMALIILTDPNPTEALRTTMKRCAYLLMPFSVLFIKYLPQYGRGFDGWTGSAYNNGVGLNKNGLGYICMVFGIFFVWNLLIARRIKNRGVRRRELLLSLGFLYMIGWLLYMSDSATAGTSLALGVTTMIVVGWRIVNKRFIGAYVLVIILIAVVAQITFDPYAQLLQFLGRKPNLTDRTQIWSDVIALQPNWLIGAGFESFWLGPRLEALWAKWWWHPNQAHNGYIEMYLNLGAIGVFLLIGVIVSTFRKTTARLQTDFDFGRLRLAFLFAIVLYSYTEAVFKGVHLVWTIFIIMAIDYRRLAKTDMLKTVRREQRLAISHGPYAQDRSPRHREDSHLANMDEAIAQRIQNESRARPKDRVLRGTIDLPAVAARLRMRKTPR